MIARLSKAGTIINSSAIYYSNSTSVFATFNLQGSPLGLYNVSLIKPDSSAAVLTDGFTIANANNGGIQGGGNNSGPNGTGNEPGCDPGAAAGLNSQLVTELVVPEKVFAGWPFIVQINYSNPTNSDIPAQVRFLYNDREMPVALTQAGLDAGNTSIYLELTEQNVRRASSGPVAAERSRYKSKLRPIHRDTRLYTLS
ncbi:MAG: hypothetical protein WDO16_17790 [Bacteroidota bacterium]